MGRPLVRVIEGKLRSQVEVILLFDPTFLSYSCFKFSPILCKLRYQVQMIVNLFDPTLHICALDFDRR